MKVNKSKNKTKMTSLLEKNLIFNEPVYTREDFEEIYSDEKEINFKPFSFDEYFEELELILEENLKFFNESCILEYYRKQAFDIFEIDVDKIITIEQFHDIKKNSWVVETLENIKIEFHAFKVLHSDHKSTWCGDILKISFMLIKKYPDFLIISLISKLLT